MKPQVLSTQIVHKNPWYQIRHDILEWTNKKSGEYFVVEDNPHVVILAEKDGCILMIRQYRHTVQIDSLDFPAGGNDDGESPEQGARRELLEETGYRADSWQQIGSFFSANGIGCLPGHVFVAHDLTDTKLQQLDDAETGLEFFWISMTEISKRISQGEITDSDTLSAWSIFTSWRERKS